MEARNTNAKKVKHILIGVSLLWKVGHRDNMPSLSGATARAHVSE